MLKIIIFCCTIVSFIQTLPIDSAKIKLNKALVSKNVDYDKECHSYKNCHDCIVSGCDFENNECIKGGPVLDTSTATREHFFNNAGKCHDVLGVCQATKGKRKAPFTNYMQN